MFFGLILNYMKKIYFFFLIFLIYNTNCTFSSEKDIFSFLNKRMYFVNYGIEKILFSPFLNFYSNNIPLCIKSGLRNFLRNSNDYKNFYINVFDFNLFNIKLIFSRVLSNTFFGIFGIFDFANHFGFFYKDYKSEKIFKDIKFLFFPILGPLTFNNFIFFVFCQVLTPHVYLFNDLTIYYFFDVINKKEEIFLNLEFVDKNMLDPFLFIKDFYFQVINNDDNVFY